MLRQDLVEGPRARDLWPQRGGQALARLLGEETLGEETSLVNDTVELASPGGARIVDGGPQPGHIADVDRLVANMGALAPERAIRREALRHALVLLGQRRAADQEQPCVVPAEQVIGDLGAHATQPAPQ